jgi:DNA-binding NtrC family response regulator
LTAHFIERLAHELGREVSGISEDALKMLMDHDWPGNVRELENAVERALVTCKGRELSEGDFHWLGCGNGSRQKFDVPGDISLVELERRAIIATLERTHGNVKEAAGSLGVDRSTLYEKLKRYEIPRG